MNSEEVGDNKCRICLQNNVELDWNDLLYDYSHLTYKDCYFKYTQLEYFDDNFSTVLCRNCSNALEYIEVFISKAIETHVMLQKIHRYNIVIKDDKDNTNCATSNLETEFVPEIKNFSMHESSRREILTLPSEKKTCSISESCTTPLAQKRKQQKRKLDRRVNEMKKLKNSMYQIKSDELLFDDKKRSKVCDNESIKKPENAINNSKEMPSSENVNLEPGHFIDIQNFDLSAGILVKQQHLKKCNPELTEPPATKKYNMKKEKYKSLPMISFEEDLNESCNDEETKSAANKKTENEREEDESLEQNINENCITKYQDGRAKEKKILLCQYCSLKIKGTNQLERHEATHSENRKRTETCPKCGIKLYTRSTLNEHMKIHDENRQKKYNCEFCEKAFFNKGTLNVHRRIHLGLMVKCQICPKEFFRQTELDKHMNSHSAALINVEPKKRSRYLVRCKYCNKNIMSTSFKSHTAAHLNEPLMKCSICSKEFFRRNSCTDHLKTIHKKTVDEYNHFIILYKRNRLSHLYLEQTTELQQN